MRTNRPNITGAIPTRHILDRRVTPIVPMAPERQLRIYVEVTAVCTNRRRREPQELSGPIVRWAAAAGATIRHRSSATSGDIASDQQHLDRLGAPV